MQTDIIICPMLYAIAVGHIKRYGEYYFLQNKWSVAYAALRATRHKSSKWLKSQPSVKRFRLAFIIVWTVIFKVLPVSRKLVRE